MISRQCLRGSIGLSRQNIFLPSLIQLIEALPELVGLPKGRKCSRLAGFKHLEQTQTWMISSQNY